MKCKTLFFLFFLFSFSLAAQKSKPPKTLKTIKSEKSVVLDGKLTESFYLKLPIERFIQRNG